MEWLTQNWVTILIAGAFAWMMFGRRGQGGGCCAGATNEQETRKPGEGATLSKSAGSLH